MGTTREPETPASGARRLLPIAACVALGAASAHAQEGAVQLEQFEPATGAGAILDVTAPDTLAPLAFRFDLWGSFATEPLVLEPVLVGDARSAGAVVADRLRLELNGALGLLAGLELGAAMPFGTTVGASTYDFAGRTAADFARFVPGDARLQLKVAPLELLGLGQPLGFGVALTAGAWLPTGDRAALEGEDAVRFEPGLSLGWRLPIVRLAADVGYHVRPASRVFTAGVDDEVRVGLGAEASLPLGFAVSVAGRAAFRTADVADPNDAQQADSGGDRHPVEVMLGAHWRGDGPVVSVGAGRGLTAAYGVPAWRGMVRFGWVFGEAPPTGGDRDQDGIDDAADGCPYEPEDHDGVRDDDGCPDEDGWRPFAAPTTAPAAGAAKATAAGAAKASGAGAAPGAAAPPAPSAPPFALADVAPAGPPLPPLVGAGDSDGDGIADALDRCPLEPEDADDFEREDGCPEPDDDGDGVLDGADRCPREAEVYNDVDDEDGCPDRGLDTDRDGIDDLLDVCPYEPEDRDGVRDWDGCPERAGARPDGSTTDLGAPAGAAGPTAAPGAPGALAAPPALPPLPRLDDLDGDGVPHWADDCPDEPEDHDGHADADGCPDPDNDGDGVPDAVDRCPDEAENENGHEDDDGCPDRAEDADRDGIDDVLDRCPLEPEDRDGVRDHDGCPELDAPPGGGP